MNKDCLKNGKKKIEKELPIDMCQIFLKLVYKCHKATKKSFTMWPLTKTACSMAGILK